MSVASVLALTLWPLAAHSPLASADTAVPSVTLSASSGLTDGQSVTVTVRTSSDVPVSQAVAHQCRAGVDYQPSTGFRPAPDFESQGPNCPGASSPISSSADASVTDANTFDNAPKADGESFLFRVGSGVVAWKDGTGADQTLTCDDTHTCDLVVELLYQPTASAHAQWKPFVFPISFGNNDPIAGCGGAAGDALQTVGSDRMQDAWVAWTLAACKAHPDVHAPGRGTFVGEGPAITSFANGALDLAYTAGGYDAAMAKGSTPTSGLTSSDLTHRPSVAVPIALNAAVIAVGGGVRVDATHKSPYTNPKLTPGELAAMFGQGLNGVAAGSDTWKSITDRNPQLKQTDLFDTSGGFIIGAYADGEASSWYWTKWLHDSATAAWRVPNLPNLFGADSGKPRQVDAALGVASPSYSNAVSLLSGRPALRKGLIGPGPNTQGGIWVMTDAATAAAFGLVPVNVPDSSGAFTAPSTAALDAAVPAMKPDDQGILVSDPKALPAGAYPLTMVEYALVPTQPLLNDDCTPRTGAEKLLTDWLTFVTTNGQTILPAGMAALPGSLRTQAADAIKKVGTAAVTGKCADTTQPPTITPSSSAAGQASAPGTGSASSPASVGVPVSSSSVASDVAQPPSIEAASATPAAAGAGGEAEAALATDVSPKVPPFAGRRASAWASPLVAVIGVVALTSLALFSTAKSTGR